MAGAAEHEVDRREEAVEKCSLRASQRLCFDGKLRPSERGRTHDGERANDCRPPGKIRASMARASVKPRLSENSSGRATTTAVPPRPSGRAPAASGTAIRADDGEARDSAAVASKMARRPVDARQVSSGGTPSARAHRRHLTLAALRGLYLVCRSAPFERLAADVCRELRRTEAKGELSWSGGWKPRSAPGPVRSAPGVDAARMSRDGNPLALRNDRRSSSGPSGRAGAASSGRATG